MVWERLLGTVPEFWQMVSNRVYISLFFFEILLNECACLYFLLLHKLSSSKGHVGYWGSLRNKKKSQKLGKRIRKLCLFCLIFSYDAYLSGFSKVMCTEMDIRLKQFSCMQIELIKLPIVHQHLHNIKNRQCKIYLNVKTACANRSVIIRV